MHARGGDAPAPGTVVELFQRAIARYDKPDALRVRQNERWVSISHEDVKERVRRVSLALQHLGISSGDRVAILSENRPEWSLTDYACLTAGIIDVPVYPTLPAEQIQHVLNDSGAVGLLLSSAQHAKTVASLRGTVPALRHVIGFDEDTAPHVDLTFSELERRGVVLDTPERRSAFEARAAQVK